MSDTARICNLCGWEDLLWKPPEVKSLRKGTSEQRIFDEGYSNYFQCPYCKHKFFFDSPPREAKAVIRCPNIICHGLFIAEDNRITPDRPGETRNQSTGPNVVITTVPTPKIESFSSERKQDIPKTPAAPATSVETSRDRTYFRKGLKEVKKSSEIKLAPARPAFFWIKWSRSLKKLTRIGILLAIFALIGLGIFAGTNALVNSSNTNVKSPASNKVLIIHSIECASITDTAAVIKWQTSLPSKGEVEYGISDALGYSSGSSKELVTSHTIQLSGLTPQTTYYFKVKSSLKDGTLALSETNKSFTTLPPPDNTAPIISDVKISDITDIGATITWKTDELTKGKIEYGTSTKYGNNMDSDTKQVDRHTVRLTGLSPATTYNLVIKAIDSSNNEAVSDNFSFTTSPVIKSGYGLNERALDFTLPTLNGETVTLSKLQGKLVLLNFWFLGCGGCLAELPHIEEIHRTWTGNKELVVLTVDIKDYTIRLKNYMESKNYTFPVLLDTEDTNIYQKYGVTSAPKTFFIDTSGIIRKIQNGRFNNISEIKEILDSM